MDINHSNDLLEQMERDDLQSLPPQSVNTKSKYKIYSGSEAFEEYKRLQDRYGEGIITGYSRVNDYFKFLPSQLYLISASTHVGKTMMSLNMCSYVAMTGKKVLFISLEQGVFVASLVQKITGGIFPETLSILDTSEMMGVKDLLKVLKDLDKYDLICLDHLHFLKKEGRGATEDVSVIIHELQSLVKEIETPMLVISHLRKLNSERFPTLDDLKDTVSLSQVPSVIMMLHRAEKDGVLENEGLMFIRKNRIQGKTGVLKFFIHEKVKVTFDEKDIVEQAVDIFND